MKKSIFATLLIASAFSAQAADYPAECRELIELTYEAAEVMPEMKGQLEMDKETMIKVSLDAWEKMSEADRAAALPGCKTGAAQMKEIIAAAKAQKK